MESVVRKVSGEHARLPLMSRVWPATILASVVCYLAPVAATGIDDPTCEMIGPEVYRLDYHASPATGAVEVWLSSRPDRIDSDKPVLVMKQPPAEVRIAGRSGRVYFHLRPPSGIPRVVSIRRLPLDGAPNFRDLGGYRTSDGRYVKWGLVYRSGHLANLTATDYQYLGSLGIRLVCDVRTESERVRFPTRWIGQTPELLLAPIGQDRDATERLKELKQRLEAPGPSVSNSPGGYDRYLIDFAGQYGMMLRRLVAGDLPMVEHCTGGKDRTGVFSAILLTALGVSRDIVIQDYLLTNRYLLSPDTFEKTTADLQRLLDLPQPPDRSFVQAMLATTADTLESSFAVIERTYGSFGSYLRDGLKLSDSDVGILQERLLEP
jgi:protein-tyrosine phosphatase